MSILEYIYKPLNAISFIFTGFLSICMIILNLLAAQIRRKRKISVRRKSSLDRFLSSHETQLSRKFQIHSFILKRFAQQISEDRKRIEESILKNYYYFQEQTFEDLQIIQPSIQATLHAFAQQKYLAENKQTEQILETLAALKNDFSELKNQFHRLLYSFNVSMQQQGSDSEKITNILKEAKKDLTRLITVNRAKEKEIFQTVLKFLHESQSDIRKEVTLFSFVADYNEPLDEENSKLNLEITLDRMERMKKNLISSHTILNRQYMEMGKLQLAVTRFSQKFAHFVVIFDRVWNQNKKSKSSYRQLEEADAASSSLTKKIDMNANSLIRQLKMFAGILSDVKNMLTTNMLNLDRVSPSISKKLEECSLEFDNSADTAWINNVDILNQKLENMLQVNENSKGKLESLKRISNHFENYHNLMKSMTRSYNTLLRFFLSALERSQKFPRAPKRKLKQNKKVAKNVTESFDKDNNLRKIVEMDENCIDDFNIWDEIRSELDIKLKNVDINKIVFILKDIMRVTRKFFDEGQIIPGDIYEAATAQSDDFKQWGDFPSESLLTDVSSEFLVRSSDESTCELSEVTLE